MAGGPTDFNLPSHAAWRWISDFEPQKSSGNGETIGKTIGNYRDFLFQVPKINGGYPLVMTNHRKTMGKPWENEGLLW